MFACCTTIMKKYLPPLLQSLFIFHCSSWTQFFKKSAVSSICIYLHTFDPELLRVTTLHHDDWLRIVLSILSCSRVTAL